MRVRLVAESFNETALSALTEELADGRDMAVFSDNQRLFVERLTPSSISSTRTLRRWVGDTGEHLPEETGDAGRRELLAHDLRRT